jgi:hypothetical protein
MNQPSYGYRRSGRSELLSATASRVKPIATRQNLVVKRLVEKGFGSITGNVTEEHKSFCRWCQ